MGKLHEHKYIIIVALLVLGVFFYWFQYRPSEIKKDCAKLAKNEAQKSWGLNQNEYDIKYKNCLREKGL